LSGLISKPGVYWLLSATRGDSTFRAGSIHDRPEYLGHLMIVLPTEMNKISFESFARSYLLSTGAHFGPGDYCGSSFSSEDMRIPEGIQPERLQYNLKANIPDLDFEAITTKRRGCFRGLRKLNGETVFVFSPDMEADGCVAMTVAVVYQYELGIKGLMDTFLNPNFDIRSLPKYLVAREEISALVRARLPRINKALSALLYPPPIAGTIVEDKKVANPCFADLSKVSEIFHWASDTDGLDLKADFINVVDIDEKRIHAVLITRHIPKFEPGCVTPWGSKENVGCFQRLTGLDFWFSDVLSTYLAGQVVIDGYIVLILEDGTQECYGDSKVRVNRLQVNLMTGFIDQVPVPVPDGVVTNTAPLNITSICKHYLNQRCHLKNCRFAHPSLI